MAAPGPRRRAASRPRAAARSAPGSMGEPLAGGAPPVLLVTGADMFARDDLLADLKRSLVAEGFEGFDYATLWGEEISGLDLAAQAEMLPMAGPAGRRLIVVRRADRIREKDAEAIGAYAASPAPSSCLVLVCDQARAPIVTAVGRSARRVDLPAPRDYQMARWLQGRATAMDLALDPGAAAALAELVGGDHVAGVSELRRAALMAPQSEGGKARISRETVEDLAARGLDANPFHLGDALLSRETVRALRIVRDLHGVGSTGYALVGMLEGQFRRFMTMRARMDAGEAAMDVVRSTSPTLPPDVKARLARQVESFDLPRLVEALRIARQTDRAIKSYGSGSELAHMESLVWRICAL